MSIALGEFWKGLVKSGVADATGCKGLAADYANANAGTPPSDSGELAGFLVQRGVLTDFQAQALLSDPPREIRSGNYLVRAQAGPDPLRRWIPVSRLDDQRVGVLFRVAADQLSGGREQWLTAHQEVEHGHLQHFDNETQQAWTLVFTELPEGRSLSGLLADGVRFSPRQVCELGICLADALAAMHERPLVHGAVRAEQVWMGKDGQTILLRDPSGPPAGMVKQPTGWFDGQEEIGFYAAPEFSNSGQECTAATDIYALGCLLFRLASGRFPVDGDSTDQLVQAHAKVTPPELTEAVKKGESGDPLYRVLAFALAKAPASRFAEAKQLSNALTTILPLVSAKATSVDTGQTEKPVESVPVVTETKSTLSDKPSAHERGNSNQGPVGETPAKSQPRPPSGIGVANASAAEINMEDDRVESGGPAVSVKNADLDKGDKGEGSVVVAEKQAKGKPVAVRSQTAVPPSPPPVASEENPPARRARRKKRSKAPFVLGAMCVAILLLMIGLLVPSSPEEETTAEKVRPPRPAVIPRVSNRDDDDDDEREDGGRTKGKAKKSSATDGYQLVEDDQLLYVPPYAADKENPLLDYLPPGPAVVATFNLASILESSIGDQVIEAFSPELDNLLAVVAERAKVPLEDIANCGLTLHPGKEGWPEVSLAIQLKTPVSASELIEKWDVAASRTADGVTIYAGDALGADAFYLQGKGEDPVTRFAIGSVERIGEVAEMEGSGILLPRNSQALWNANSRDADLVVLFASPNFLFADGREMLASSLPGFVDPLKTTLQPDVAAFVITVDFGAEQMFAETRMSASGGTSAAALVRKLQERIGSWTGWADDFIVNSVPDASWRLLANRLRSMVGFVAQRVRYGVSDDMAVANVYVPAQAVPQVTLATVLALNTPEGGAVAAGAPKVAKTLTVEEMLNRKMSVTFDQESLEFAVDNIVTAFERDLPSGSKMPKIRIIGGDLQLMGITQNQQVRDFKQANVPLRQVLTELVRRANPDKTATGANDEKQALIWVVVDDAAKEGVKEILITTRESAAGKYELPTEFKLD